jgi:hypothetical protein
MAGLVLPGPSNKVLVEPKGLTRTPDDLTLDELAYLFDYCVKYDVGDIIQSGSGVSTALMSQFAVVTAVENDEKATKRLVAAAPPGPETFNYVVLKPNLSFEGSGTTQKSQIYVINGMREQSIAEFELLQRAMSDAYEWSDVVMVADGMSLNTLRLQMKHLAPYYNVVAIVPSVRDGLKDRYLIHWERNLLTKRKSVI